MVVKQHCFNALDHKIRLSSVLVQELYRKRV